MRMKTIETHYIDAWNCLEICLTNKRNIFLSSHTFVLDLWETDDVTIIIYR